MVPEYIVEICVAIDIAILGIAYPIIVDKISNIGDKYMSRYISVLFDNEFPQRSLSVSLNKKIYSISIFKLILYTTLVSLFFLIFKFPPLFAWDNWLVNNSAKYIVFALSLLFTVSFFIWLDKVVLYNGKSTSLLKYIISNYDLLKNDTDAKQYHLKSINELTFYSIEKQDEHLQETLLDFYYRVFAKIRKDHNKTKPLVYPIDLYFLVSKLNIEVINNDNKKLKALEHRAVSGIWLFGEDSENVVISEETYNWTWRNLYNICDHSRLVKMFWSNSNQYLTYRLKMVQPRYDYALNGIGNQKEIDDRQEERKHFLELHFALGGLMLYREQYDTIKYFFEYTQSQPPKYELLPGTMTEIFSWFEHFNNEFKFSGVPIDIKYSFPGLDSVGSRSKVIYWICSYIAVLFIRQYTLHQYYTFQNFTALPNLPDEVMELSSWLENVSYFERCLNTILLNEDLIKNLGYSKVVQDKSEDFKNFISSLKESIESKIGNQKMNADLSVEKLQSFYTSSGNIIANSFEKYNSIFNSDNEKDFKNKISYSVHGGVVLMSKSSFTDNDIPTLNYDSFFAGQVASQNIERMIPNSFTISSTKRYLLNKENIILGLERIIGGSTDSVIVGVDVGYELKQVLDNSKFKDMVRYIPSSEYDFQDVLFVLAESSLPTIKHEEIDADKIQDLKLVPINEKLKAYASVLDINKKENEYIKKRWNLDDDSEELDLKVQLAIIFSSVIFWDDKREVIQINIASEYREQGIQNEIGEVDPMKPTK
jgi:hypothetical protein